MKKYKYIRFILIMNFILATLLFAEKPNRVGTTMANFLEIGYGSAGSAMGDAYVAIASDLSAMYWNPAGMAFMKKSAVQFTTQPWIVDIKTNYSSVGIVLPGIGTLGIGFLSTDYGDMEVTTETYQDGTGEMFDASDYAINISYARALTNWFAFGASGKYIGSDVYHMYASAIAMDLGVVVNTKFFSPTGDREQGLRIGMSISNYGTRMQYSGIDAIQPVDVDPYHDGNYQYTQTEFRMTKWELPLIFRIGVAIIPIYTENSKVRLAIDALHNNNSAEYINSGIEYELNVPGTGKFFLRGGYKGIFLPDSQYGVSFGGGFEKLLMNNFGLKFDYAFRDIGILGNVHSYSIGFKF